MLDQKVENGKRILTLQKRPVPHFCPVSAYRMHSKGITPRTINHPVMQDGLQLILIVDQRRLQCTNPACRNIVTDEFSFVEKHKRNTKLADILIVDEFRNAGIPAAERNRVKYLVSDMYRLYIAYVDKYFPNAISVVDSFHVVKFINHQIRLVKNYQWIILKKQSELKYSAPASYQYHLGFYADIHKLEYMLFQIDPNLKDFRRLKEKYIMCADGTHRSRLSNGPIESLNRIVKDLKRNGRGFLEALST